MATLSPGQLDYYRILGLPYTATPAEIKRAYRTAMKRSHPDRSAPEFRAAAEERAREINEAFRVLSNPEAKRYYDQQLKVTMAQDQIMSRYAGGFGAPGTNNDIYERIKEAQRAEQRKMRKTSDRQASHSLLLVFAGFALIVLLIFLMVSVAGALLRYLA